jgi:hypothetical protein
MTDRDVIVPGTSVLEVLGRPPSCLRNYFGRPIFTPAIESRRRSACVWEGQPLGEVAQDRDDWESLA